MGWASETTPSLANLKSRRKELSLGFWRPPSSSTSVGSPMAKGDDALRRKKNKANRKRIRSSDSSVSACVASIIASKRRRKLGKRRICEGMCFTLPTAEDPFNDRHDKKSNKNKNKNKKNIPSSKPQPNDNDNNNDEKRIKPIAIAADGELKFLTLCLNAIQSSWKQDDGEVNDGDASRKHLLASSWGAELWSRCSSGSNVVVDCRGDFVEKEQLAWLVSTASDIFTRKEKQGQAIAAASPFLLFLVPTQEMALQVRSVCRPLKALGIHTVSLHPGASMDHQIHGLKSCEPEFLVSTPERLLELVQLRAIDISEVSLLVLDGMKSSVDLNLFDKVKSIKKKITEEPQMVIFNDSCEEFSASLLQSLLNGPVCRLSLDDFEVCQNDM